MGDLQQPLVQQPLIAVGDEWEGVPAMTWNGKAIPRWCYDGATRAHLAGPIGGIEVRFEESGHQQATINGQTKPLTVGDLDVDEQGVVTQVPGADERDEHPEWPDGSRQVLPLKDGEVKAGMMLVKIDGQPYSPGLWASTLAGCHGTASYDSSTLTGCEYTTKSLTFHRTDCLPHSGQFVNIMKRAYKFTFWAVVVAWIFWLFPIVVLRFTSCDLEGGIAKVPSWLPGMYAPILALEMYLEFRAHQVVVPPIAYWLGGYTVGGKGVPLLGYLVGLMGLSAVGKLDLATGAILVARLQKTDRCTESVVSDIWARSLPLPLPSLGTLVLLAWILMGSQLILCLCRSIPFGPQEFPHSWRSHSTPFNHLTKWLKGESDEMKTYFEPEVFAPSAVHALATCARMGCLNFQHWKLVDKVYGTEALSSGIKDWYMDRDTLAGEMNALAENVGVFLLVESTLKINIQVCVLSVSAQATNGQLDPLTVASVTLSIFMAVKNMMTAGKGIKHLNQMLEPYIDPDNVKDVYGENKARVTIRKAKVQRAWRIYRTSSSVMLLGLTFALTKLFLF